jgi:hypothetical protein
MYYKKYGELPIVPGLVKSVNKVINTTTTNNTECSSATDVKGESIEKAKLNANKSPKLSTFNENEFKVKVEPVVNSNQETLPVEKIADNTKVNDSNDLDRISSKQLECENVQGDQDEVKLSSLIVDKIEVKIGIEKSAQNEVAFNQKHQSPKETINIKEEVKVDKANEIICNFSNKSNILPKLTKSNSSIFSINQMLATTSNNNDQVRPEQPKPSLMSNQMPQLKNETVSFVQQQQSLPTNTSSQEQLYESINFMDQVTNALPFLKKLTGFAPNEIELKNFIEKQQQLHQMRHLEQQMFQQKQTTIQPIINNKNSKADDRNEEIHILRPINIFIPKPVELMKPESNAAFVRVWDRGPNSCSRTDLQFKYMPNCNYLKTKANKADSREKIKSSSSNTPSKNTSVISSQNEHHFIPIDHNSAQVDSDQALKRLKDLAFKSYNSVGSSEMNTNTVKNSNTMMDFNSLNVNNLSKPIDFSINKPAQSNFPIQNVNFNGLNSLDNFRNFNNIMPNNNINIIPNSISNMPNVSGISNGINNSNIAQHGEHPLNFQIQNSYRPAFYNFEQSQRLVRPQPMMGNPFLVSSHSNIIRPQPIDHERALVPPPKSINESIMPQISSLAPMSSPSLNGQIGQGGGDYLSPFIRAQYSHLPSISRPMLSTTHTLPPQTIPFNPTQALPNQQLPMNNFNFMMNAMQAAANRFMHPKFPGESL